uniref:PLA2c domain-containing protein n=1 Tax=Erpetoichthys calabaricus TaxID=27687 RepID=A0A8C4RN15_ERPCA
MSYIVIKRNTVYSPKIYCLIFLLTISKQVPVIAVLGSGGGIRAMLSLLGSLSGLQEIGVLDCVTYICGVSGSTCHQKSVKRGINPYPVYAAINKEAFDIEEKCHPEIWFEFTPHECGFPYYEAFIETSDFGSKFEEEAVTKSHPELDVCHLQGMGINLHSIKTIKETLFRCQRDPELLNYLSNSLCSKCKYIYICIHTYIYKNLKNIDNMIEKEFVSLVDAGLAINCAYPLMLHPKRKVDVIISLDYSDGDIFETLTLAKDFADANNLRFPSVDTKDEQPEDCSVYSGPSTPTVIHMPLFNEFNKHGGLADSFHRCLLDFKLWLTESQCFVLCNSWVLLVECLAHYPVGGSMTCD